MPRAHPLNATLDPICGEVCQGRPRATEACLCVGAVTGGCDGEDVARWIVVEAELVLLIAIGDPEVDGVRVFLADKGLAGIERHAG